MKVIFLDIDGVLNSEKSEQIPWCDIDLYLLELLMKFIRDNDIKLIITSDRRGLNIRSTVANFKYHSTLHVLNDFIVGVTPFTVDRSRSREIQLLLDGDWKTLYEQNYISEQLYNDGIDNYIILDDIDLSNEFNENHFIYVDWSTGLRSDHINKAKEIFEKL